MARRVSAAGMMRRGTAWIAGLAGQSVAHHPQVLQEPTPLSASRWFIRPVPRPLAEVRLICLPYAGGSAAIYMPWASSLPDSVELVCAQPPGRSSRMGEAAHATMDAMVADFATAFAGLRDKPYVLFGHSLGSRVAYAFARQCAVLGVPGPVHLIASGSRAPHVQSTRTSIHDLPKDEFVAKLRELDGTPEEILENAELLDLLIPLLRADFRIADMYRAAVRPLECPLTVLAGVDDHEVAAVDVDAWAELTTAGCDVHWLPGGHFFINEHRAAVLARVNQVIGRATRSLMA